MNKKLETKLKELPKTPGVYFHKDKQGDIIYIGKAANLRNRVRQYFQKSRARDVKTEALVAEIHDVDWMEVDSELEALFVEAEQVRRYLPKYNILLRDDKSLIYIRISYNSDHPTVSTTRRPLDDGAKYYGPYISTYAVRQALRHLRKIFPYATRKIGGQKRATLHYHIGLDPGLEEGKTSLEDYRKTLKGLMAVIEGRQKTVEKQLEQEMQSAAKIQDFEKAATLRNRLFHLRSLGRQIIFSNKEFEDISKDHALSELVEALGLTGYPERIEGYDISHQQGTDVVASMVVFSNGVSNRGEYRKFKMHKDINDDFKNMHQTILRRFGKTNIKKWGLPKLVLIDGGKGQLTAALKARDEADIKVPFIGLAKREEQVVVHKDSLINVDIKAVKKLNGYIEQAGDFTVLNMPTNSNMIKLLQRIRDESHRFAVSYHSSLKRKRQTSSMLDEIEGVGPATRKRLIRRFGSLRGVKEASLADLRQVLSMKQAVKIFDYLKNS